LSFEFALLLVEGGCFGQDIFGQDEQDGTSDPMAASHRIAIHAASPSPTLKQ